MAPWDGPSTPAMGAGALVLLLLGPLFAGCLATPSTELQARRGDHAHLELVIADETVQLPNQTIQDPTQLCGAPLAELGEDGCPAARAPYVLLNEPPAAEPEGFANATGLPDALIEQIGGLREGEHIHAEDVQVWGPHRPGLVVEHDRRTQLPRTVEDPEAYGYPFEVDETEEGTYRIQPAREDEGAQLEVTDWCNERFCLFTSRLVGWNDTHLTVEHEAEEGQRVHVSSLSTSLEVVDAREGSFTVDGNDPRAGEGYEVYARVVDLRGPAEGDERAPSFEVTTLEGQALSLEAMLGQPVVIEFFATWCPSCRENAEHLADVHERFGEDVRIVSIGVDPWEDASSLAAFIEEHGVTWPVGMDETGEIANAYSVGTLSTEVIVDAHGTIRLVETGVADHDRVVGVLEALVEEAQAEGETT